jgi:hypothetical protein
MSGVLSGIQMTPLVPCNTWTPQSHHSSLLVRRYDVVSHGKGHGSLVGRMQPCSPGGGLRQTQIRRAESQQGRAQFAHQVLRAQRHPLRMVAGRGADDAASQLLWAELRHLVVRTAQLERLDRLHTNRGRAQAASQAGQENSLGPLGAPLKKQRVFSSWNRRGKE